MGFAGMNSISLNHLSSPRAHPLPPALEDPKDLNFWTQKQVLGARLWRGISIQACQNALVDRLLFSPVTGIKSVLEQCFGEI